MKVLLHRIWITVKVIMGIREKDSVHYLMGFLLCLIGFIASGLTVDPSAASDKYSESAVISLDVQYELLGVVLESISNATGRRIVLTPGWADLPVTARLNGVSVEEALKRLLNGFSYALVVDEKGEEISIEVRGFSSNRESAAKWQETAGGKEGHRRAEGLNPTDQEVIPPEEREFSGLTEGKVLTGDASEGHFDPLDVEVLPPAAPGQCGVTLRELEARKTSGAKIDPHDLEVLPPEAPGRRGVTLRELKTRSASQGQIDIRGLEVIPPED